MPPCNPSGIGLATLPSQGMCQSKFGNLFVSCMVIFITTADLSLGGTREICRNVGSQAVLVRSCHEARSAVLATLVLMRWGFRAPSSPQGTAQAVKPRGSWCTSSGPFHFKVILWTREAGS